MKAKFKISGIDCANCAAKLERKLQKIDGVETAALNFMMGTLLIEGDDDKADAILAEITRLVHKMEPDAALQAL